MGGMPENLRHDLDSIQPMPKCPRDGFALQKPAEEGNGFANFEREMPEPSFVNDILSNVQ